VNARAYVGCQRQLQQQKNFLHSHQQLLAGCLSLTSRSIPFHFQYHFSHSFPLQFLPIPLSRPNSKNQQFPCSPPLSFAISNQISQAIFPFACFGALQAQILPQKSPNFPFDFSLQNCPIAWWWTFAAFDRIAGFFQTLANWINENFVSDLSSISFWKMTPLPPSNLSVSNGTSVANESPKGSAQSAKDIQTENLPTVEEIRKAVPKECFEKVNSQKQ
jgi:hypothetical protein